MRDRAVERFDLAEGQIVGDCEEDATERASDRNDGSQSQGIKRA